MTAVEPRRRQPRMPLEFRREQILDAAARLITADGFAAASMEAVAREANIAKPRVYTAFPTRAELLTAVLEREERRVVADLADAMPEWSDTAEVADILAAAGVNLLSAVAAKPTSWRLLTVATEDAPDEVKEHMAVGRAFALGNLVRLLSWARERGQLAAGFDIDLAANLLLSAGEGAVRLVLADPETFSADRFRDFAASLAGLVRPGVRDAPEPG